MKKRIILIFLLIMANSAKAQDPWSVYMTPTEIHTLFSQYTGSFKMEMTVSMGKDKEPTIFTINSDHQMLLGDRFLELKQQGDMMGMDYQCVTILGFNTIDKQVALTTITNMGTGTLSMFGEWDEKTKSATLYGQLTNPVTKNTINVKQTISFPDKDTILIESYDQEGDKPEIKSVQYKFIRK